MSDLVRSELSNIKSAIFAHIISAYPSGAHKLQVMNFFWKHKKKYIGNPIILSHEALTPNPKQVIIGYLHGLKEKIHTMHP